MKATYLDSWYFGPPHANYVVTITRVPRQGYNATGGTSQANAPLLTSLPAGVKAAVHPNEPRQYWKVQLPAGATLKAVGRVRAPTTYGGALLYVKVFNAAGAATTILGMSAPAGGGWVSFETSTFTNTTGQTADFWVAAEAVVRVVEVEMSVIQNNVLPQLSLFLDANGDFSVNAPSATDDSASYVPGTNLTTGLSAAVSTMEGSGQATQVIAAFVDASGQVVPPPGTGNVTFGLTNTTALTGIAMNYGTGTLPDFALSGGPGIAFASDNTARITLLAYDYGGSTTVTAERGTTLAPPLRVPKDNGVGTGVAANWLPDGGWIVIPALASVPDNVQDSWGDLDGAPAVDPPPSGGLVGDGLTRFEEYRGFVLRGIHTRTNPDVKDVFLASNIWWMQDYISIGYSVNLPLAVHHAWGETDEGVPLEYVSAEVQQGQHYRVINMNAANNAPGGPSFQGHIDQRAVLARAEAITNPNTNIIGNTFYPFYATATPPCPPSGGGIPNDLPYIQIDLQRHQDFGSSVGNLQSEINNEIRRTVGHEYGHSLHLMHRRNTNVCSDGADVGDPDSIMSSDWADGHDSTDYRSQYNVYDARQIRLIP